MKTVKIFLFLIVLLLSRDLFAKEDILNFYNNMIETCTHGKSNFADSLLDLDKKMKEYAKSIVDKKNVDSLYQDKNLLGDIYSYLGTELIPDHSDLRGLKACGKYYTEFLKFYASKKTNLSDENFASWQSCLYSDYYEAIPEVPKKIIACYGSRIPKNIKKGILNNKKENPLPKSSHR